MRALMFVCSAFALFSTGCNSGRVLNQAGKAYYDQGNYAMASQEFQRAVAANPYNADYIANLAASKMRQGDQMSAEQAWRHALQINPSHQPSYHGLARMLVENNRHQDAQALLGTWTASQPYSAESHLEMAWLHRETGNEAGAAQELQQALQINPNHAKAQAALGQYYQDTGRTAEAMTMYQHSLRNNWYQPEVQSRLATMKGFRSPQMAFGPSSFGGPMGGYGNVSTAASVGFPPVPQVAGGPMHPQIPSIASNPAPMLPPASAYQHATAGAGYVTNPTPAAMGSLGPYQGRIPVSSVSSTGPTFPTTVNHGAPPQWTPNQVGAIASPPVTDQFLPPHIGATTSTSAGNTAGATPIPEPEAGLPAATPPRVTSSPEELTPF